jgi:hypothetical protein
MNTARAVTVLLSVVALGAALLTNAEIATAKIVRWELQNVTFADGGTAGGFFLWDAEASGVKQIVSWDIAIDGMDPPCPPCIPPFRFTPASGWGDGGSGIYGESEIMLQSFSSFYDRRNFLELRLIFESILSDAGGRVAILGPGQSAELLGYFGVIRSITGGQVIAIPELSEALFLALGLAVVMSFLAWRRKYPSCILFTRRTTEVGP